MRILALSGSTRRGSSNTAVLEAVRLLAPPGVDVELYDGLARLSAFDGEELAAHGDSAWSDPAAGRQGVNSANR